MRSTTMVTGGMRLLIAGVLLSLPWPSVAQDCTCNAVTSGPLEWTRGQYQGSTYVFYGTVTSVAPPMPDSNETRDQPTFIVNEAFKGDFNGGEVRGADCGSGILPGDSAMIFLDGYHRIKSCSIRVKGITEQDIRNAVRELSREEDSWKRRQTGEMDGTSSATPRKSK